MYLAVFRTETQLHEQTAILICSFNLEDTNQKLYTPKIKMTLDRNLANGKINENEVIPLPEGGSHCKLHLLGGGSLIASESRLHSNIEDRFFRLYNWAFLITASDGRHVLWDYRMSSVSRSNIFLLLRIYFVDNQSAV